MMVQSKSAQLEQNKSRLLQDDYEIKIHMTPNLPTLSAAFLKYIMAVWLFCSTAALPSVYILMSKTNYNQYNDFGFFYQNLLNVWIFKWI